MKRYVVEVQPRAEQDMKDAFNWLREQAPVAAAKWYAALVLHIDSLEYMPLRCQFSKDKGAREIGVRQLLFGKRPHQYRILFTIRAESVVVLRVRHGRREYLKEDELGLE